MNIEIDLRYFYSHFIQFYRKLSLLLKYVKIVNKSVADLIFKDKKVFLTILIFFWLNFWVNISKFSLFHQKLHEVRFFGPL